MRVAVVRGPNLNPWELANFDPSEVELVAFGSRAGAFEAHDLQLEPRRLHSPADVVARLPPLGQGLVRRFTGPVDHLFGLERALRGFDVAHVAELNTAYSRQALRAREAGAVRRVVATVWENIPLPAAENPVVARRVRAVAAGLDHCVAITERARLHLRLAGVPDERIEVLPMGVDVERFAPAADGEQSGDGRALRVLSRRAAGQREGRRGPRRRAAAVARAWHGRRADARGRRSAARPAWRRWRPNSA